jgi:hypothetical protein
VGSFVWFIFWFGFLAVLGFCFYFCFEIKVENQNFIKKPRKSKKTKNPRKLPRNKSRVNSTQSRKGIVEIIYKNIYL